MPKEQLAKFRFQHSFWKQDRNIYTSEKFYMYYLPIFKFEKQPENVSYFF